MFAKTCLCVFHYDVYHYVGCKPNSYTQQVSIMLGLFMMTMIKQHWFKDDKVEGVMMAARESATSKAHARRWPPLTGLELSARGFGNLLKFEAGDRYFLTRFLTNPKDVMFIKYLQSLMRSQ